MKQKIDRWLVDLWKRALAETKDPDDGLALLVVGGMALWLWHGCPNGESETKPETRQCLKPEAEICISINPWTRSNN